MKPVIVDWQITSSCTRDCTFCYGPKSTKELSFEDISRIIDTLKHIGVKVVGITGGEPLLRDDIVDILKYIKGKEMGICLSTNCDLYSNYRDVIKKYVDAIGIPVESSDKKIHDSLRGGKNFDNVVFALNDISENCNMKIRIGTVLTNKNYHTLEELELFLSKFDDNIVYWKIYEYICYSLKSQNDNLIIDDYRSLSHHINGLGKYINSNKIIIDTLEKRNCSYFLIKPNGDAFIPLLSQISSTEYILGNLLEHPDEVIDKWKKNINYINYTQPYRCMFRSDENLKCRYDC